jgi:hypothetical protein
MIDKTKTNSNNGWEKKSMKNFGGKASRRAATWKTEDIGG